MRIALDAMGGDHAPEPIVAGAVQAVAADPDLRVVLVGDQARIEPLLTRPPAIATGSRSSTARQVVGMEESPVVACARSPTTRSAVAGSCSPSARWTASSAPATPAPWWPAGCPQRFLKNVHRPGIAAVMPTLAGPASDRRRRQRQSQGRAPFPVRRHGQHLRQPHPAATATDHRPDERRLGRGQGPRPGQGNPRPVQRQPAARTSSSATSRAATSTRAWPTSSSPTASWATSCSRVCEGRLRVLHEDGGQGSAQRPERRSATRPRRPCKTLVIALRLQRATAALRCWASTASASSATAAPATGPSRTPWPSPPVRPRPAQRVIVQELENMPASTEA